MSWLRGTICALSYILFCSFFSAAQTHGMSPEDLLDHLAGSWVLQGTIAGKPTTHDVKAAWVLNREYLQMHEISREKNRSGGAAYEAIVYLSWDAKAQQYTCLWLDSTAGGGLSAEGLAHGNQAADSIPLVFTLSPSDQIHTTFHYDKTADTWQWLIDNVENGKTRGFANVTLRRGKNG